MNDLTVVVNTSLDLFFRGVSRKYTVSIYIYRKYEKFDGFDC